jgi:hypothetical protein
MAAARNEDEKGDVHAFLVGRTWPRWGWAIFLNTQS